MELMKAIEERQSCRAYTGEQITDNALQKILEAANAAPVAMGKYDDVRLTVVQDKELLTKLDAAGAKYFRRPDARPTYGAPTVILVLSKLPESPQNPVPYSNAACFVENMSLAATDLGLGSVYLMGAILGAAADPALCKELKVPEGFAPTSALAVGKPSAPLKNRSLTLNKVTVDYIK